MSCAKVDNNKDFWHGAWEIISRFTWQLPQTVLGVSYSVLKNTVFNVDKVFYYRGVTYVLNLHSHNTRGITISNYINIDDPKNSAYKENVFAPHNHPLYMHEYGHYIQSQKYGLLYLPVIGIPSLTVTAYDNIIADHTWMERNANQHAARFFGYDYIVWEELYGYKYPIFKNSTSNIKQVSL